MSVHNLSPHMRPSPGTATERVWAIADDITRKTGRRAKRQQVIEKYVTEGGNRNTASTQYYYWSRSRQYGDRTAKGTSATCAPVLLRVEANGRLLIPADLREAMELGEDGKVTARLVEGELRLISPRTALRKLRETAKRLAPDGASVVDEFIAEKRDEAARE